MKKPVRSAVSLLNPSQAAFAAGDDALSAPIPGLILEVRVQVGDRVCAGQIVAIMEAMKMENNLIAQKEGVVPGRSWRRRAPRSPPATSS